MHPPLLVRRDIDGFFGLFVDNLINLILMVALWTGVLGLPVGIVTTYVLPGAALSIAFGNLFYFWQARRLAKREGRADVTALPYGINTPSLFAYLFVIIGPVYAMRLADLKTLRVDAPVEDLQLEAARFAWFMGVVACFGSGVIEFLGAFAAKAIKRYTPRAAMLSTLGAIAITLISMPFLMDLFHSPLVAFLPLALIFVGYFAQVRMPLGLPAGLCAVLAGCVLAWGLGPGVEWANERFDWRLPTTLSPLATQEGHGSAVDRLREETDALAARWQGEGAGADPAGLGRGASSWFAPTPVVGEVAGWLARFGSGEPGYDWHTLLAYLSLVGVMGLMNALGTLQNLESAEAAGDRFAPRPTMLVNGLGSMLAAAFGSCYPTTVYIGHPGWKALGARQGYSALNGLVLCALCFSGLFGVVAALIPKEVGSPILLWIGVIIAAQAFQSTERRHAPAVAVGLFPALAYWALLQVNGAVKAAGLFLGGPPVTLDQSDAAQAAQAGALLGLSANFGSRIGDLLTISGGFLLSAMVLSAITVAIIDRSFKRAAIWAMIGAAASFFGFIHAGRFLKGEIIDDIGLSARFPFSEYWPIALGYGIFALVMLGFHGAFRGGDGEEDVAKTSAPDASSG